MQQKTETVPLYRVENPNIAGNPDGVKSHEALVGQWFSPSLNTALGYLRKSTQAFGTDSHPVDGAQLVIAHLPVGELEGHHVMQHPVAREMDVEGDNYVVPRDGSIETEVVALDPIVGDLRGNLGNLANQNEARQRISATIGEKALQ
ncbi:MAG TPA: hypothetical protein VFW77_03240 [Candidatus Saccharimonadales bacterium]|nr:hypothetical protein [Candidatus Saccharimonadales bacterium]